MNTNTAAAAFLRSVSFEGPSDTNKVTFDLFGNRVEGMDLDITEEFHPDAYGTDSGTDSEIEQDTLDKSSSQ